MRDHVLQQAFVLVACCSGIPLLISSFAGLIVAFLQAATQVQEQGLQFLIKLVLVSAVIAAGWNWAFEQLTDFSREAFLSSGYLSKVE